MYNSHIFSIENCVRDVKDHILPYTEYSNIRMHQIIQNVLDEICFVQGEFPIEGYSCNIGEQQALEDLLEYDIPLEVCKTVIQQIKTTILEPLTPLLTTDTVYRLSYLQLNEFEYAITIYFYTGKRYQVRPHETCYATRLPYHWAQPTG